MRLVPNRSRLFEKSNLLLLDQQIHSHIPQDTNARLVTLRWCLAVPHSLSCIVTQLCIVLRNLVLYPLSGPGLDNVQSRCNIVLRALVTKCACIACFWSACAPRVSGQRPGYVSPSVRQRVQQQRQRAFCCLWPVSAWQHQQWYLQQGCQWTACLC